MNNIYNYVTNSLSNNLINQLKNIFINGLKRKGFEFKHEHELEEFVKKHCRVEDNIDLKEKVYFVNNVPFLLHNYNIVIDLKPIITEITITMNANLGTYMYL